MWFDILLTDYGPGDLRRIKPEGLKTLTERIAEHQRSTQENLIDPLNDLADEMQEEENFTTNFVNMNNLSEIETTVKKLKAENNKSNYNSNEYRFKKTFISFKFRYISSNYKSYRY